MDALVRTCKKALPAKEKEVAEGEHGGAIREQVRAEGEHIDETVVRWLCRKPCNPIEYI